jgi:anti-sigma factor RsiW
MMNWQAEISEKDMTLLCEYLDDALSIKDRAKFETRLQQSPELKQALEDMTALKRSMRSLPCKPVPHHFTLTRSEAEKARRGLFMLPTFGWASVVSMILLAVIFGSEFIFTNFSVPQTPAEPVAMMLPDAAPESALRQAEEESGQPVYLLNWASVGGKGGGGAGGSGLPVGGMAYGMGGGLTGIAPEDAVVAEPEQPAELTLTEPMQTDEIVEPTEVASMLSEDKITVEPLIFGVREDQLGQVITIEPDQSEISAVVAAQEVVEPEKEPIIPTNVKWILAGLAAAFGLIWLLLKLKR